MIKHEAFLRTGLLYGITLGASVDEVMERFPDLQVDLQTKKQLFLKSEDFNFHFKRDQLQSISVSMAKAEDYTCTADGIQLRSTHMSVVERQLTETDLLWFDHDWRGRPFASWILLSQVEILFYGENLSCFLLKNDPYDHRQLQLYKRYFRLM